MEETGKRTREELRALAGKIRAQGESVGEPAVHAQQAIAQARVVVEAAQRVRAEIEARQAQSGRPRPQ